MNILWTIFCFNQIEALFLVYMCNAFVSNKTKFLDIVNNNYIKIFSLALLNFIVQYIPYLFDSEFIYLILSMICNIFVAPIILCIIYNKIYKIKFSKCFIINLYYFFSIVFIVSIFDMGIMVDNDKALLFEIFGNIFIKIIQFLFFVGGKLMIKKFLKKFYEKNAQTKAAFTPNGWNEPKISEQMKEEIEK